MTSNDFYSAASQIIPVLFIAGLVEARLDEERKNSDPTLELLAIGVIILGEAGALLGLATQTSSRGVAALVGLAIVIIGALITWPLIKPRHDTAREKAGDGRWPRWFDLVWLYFVLTFSLGTFVVAAVLLFLTMTFS
jgi:hypothetical protein